MWFEIYTIRRFNLFWWNLQFQAFLPRKVHAFLLLHPLFGNTPCYVHAFLLLHPPFGNTPCYVRLSPIYVPNCTFAKLPSWLLGAPLLSRKFEDAPWLFFMVRN